MLVFFPEEVVRQASAVDDVLGLFGDVGFERFEVELVTAPTELVGSVVFDAQTAELARLVVRTQAEGVHVELTDFGKAVAIHIVRIAVAVGFVHGNAVFMIVRNQGYIGSHVLFPALSFDTRQGTANLERVVYRVFGDDVDGSAHGIGTEERRSTATDHFNAFYHVGRYLFQAIHA